jgi:hypothetical protein
MKMNKNFVETKSYSCGILNTFSTYLGIKHHCAIEIIRLHLFNSFDKFRVFTPGLRTCMAIIIRPPNGNEAKALKEDSKVPLRIGSKVTAMKQDKQLER